MSDCSGYTDRYEEELKKEYMALGERTNKEQIKCNTKDCPVMIRMKGTKGFCRFCSQRNWRQKRKKQLC